VVGDGDYNTPVLLEAERRLRFNLNWSGRAISAFRSLQEMILASDVVFLDVIEFLLWKEVNSYRMASLGRHLEEGGSVWKVAIHEGVARLERRVDPTVAKATEAVIAESGRAGKHLEQAWTAAYGRNPDPSTAFRESVRAVEAAAQPVLSPKNSSATLGTMIADLANAPDKWDLRLAPPPPFDKMDALLKMLKLLWKSHFDRHGTPDDSVPLSVSQEEAETALHLATTLVHWLTSGSVLTR
jgi:hypothetical protein